VARRFIFAVLFLTSIGFDAPILAQDGFVRGTDQGAAASETLFDRVWAAFDRAYPYFIYKHINWNEIKTSYAPRFSSGMSASRFSEELAAVLDLLHDRHVSVTAPDGKVLGYNPDYPRNCSSFPRNRYCPEGYRSLGDHVVQHGRLGDKIAYIRINTLASEAYENIDKGQIDALFKGYSRMPALIIDLRNNSGGNEDIARWFASHCTAKEVLYGYTQTRNGPRHDAFSPPEPKFLMPPEDPYGGVVACLIGQRCMSSAEWLALMMKACGAVLIGDRTRGASGNPKECRLPNGVTYRMSTWMAYDAGMQPIEDRGIQPDIPMDPEASLDGGHDYVVERAIQELESILGRKKKSRDAPGQQINVLSPESWPVSSPKGK
jgi:Peptidase family S41/Tricorn protease C1 domain